MLSAHYHQCLTWCKGPNPRDLYIAYPGYLPTIQLNGWKSCIAEKTQENGVWRRAGVVHGCLVWNWAVEMATCDHEQYYCISRQQTSNYLTHGMTIIYIRTTFGGTKFVSIHVRERTERISVLNSSIRICDHRLRGTCRDSLHASTKIIWMVETRLIIETRLMSEPRSMEIARKFVARLTKTIIAATKPSELILGWHVRCQEDCTPDAQRLVAGWEMSD